MAGRLQPHATRLPLLAAAALIAAVLTALTAPSPSRAGSGEEHATHNFTFTGSEVPFTMPDGAETVHVVAVGGSGADTLSRQGGDGGRVEGDLDVTPGGQYYIAVGGTSASPAGGFNGGGDDGGGTNGGGGGGGATDIRTIGRDFAGTLASRLLVAPGGGGAGAAGVPNVGQNPGGEGGDAGSAAGEPGAGAAGVNAAGGGGGGLAVGSTGGTAGSAGAGDNGPSGEAGDAGTALSGGTGGDGNSGGGAGGGGGGGLAGGGGGGGGGQDPDSGAVPAGGGGGGGGSALVPPGGALTVAAPDTPPSLTITYTLPGTAIDGPPRRIKTRKKRKRVSFDFGATAGASVFRCRLKPTAAFEPCFDPYVLTVRRGHKYKIQAIAVADSTGNYDATPAVSRVKLVKPG